MDLDTPEKRKDYLETMKFEIENLVTRHQALRERYTAQCHESYADRRALEGTKDTARYIISQLQHLVIEHKQNAVTAEHNIEVLSKCLKTLRRVL